MKQVWKYQLQITDNQELKIPNNSDILSFDIQNGIPCIWVLVTPIYRKVVRRFSLYGTGHDIKYGDGKDRVFIGTIQTGPSVFHLFEIFNV